MTACLYCIDFDPENLALITVDARGEITGSNAAFKVMTGYTAADHPLRLSSITAEERHDANRSTSDVFSETDYCLPSLTTIVSRQGRQLPVLMGAAALSRTAGTARLFIAKIVQQPGREDPGVDYESRLRRASVELSLSAENERREIAGDLHDNISQGLAIAKLKLAQLRSEMEGKQADVVDQVLVHISDALTACRTLSHSLALPSLYSLGLVPALKNLIAEMSRDNQINFRVNFQVDDVPLPHPTRILLYRVVRELLINVIRHSQAQNADISVFCLNDTLRIVIADDGVGFDTAGFMSGTNPDAGLGLFLVRERLLHVGATFELESSEGRGTVATISTAIERVPNGSQGS